MIRSTLTDLSYRGRRWYARLHTRYLCDFAFVHINKTGGSSVEAALGLPFQHRTAAEIRDDIGPRRWARRFTFTFVRNPWDKVASHYFYRVKTNQTGLRDAGISFRDWVREAYDERNPRFYDNPKMFMCQTDWLVDGAGELLVDFVGRFERLEEDFESICRRIGRTAPPLPHLKSSSRPPYAELYDADSSEMVRRRFAEDLDRFGYEFGE